MTFTKRSSFNTALNQPNPIRALGMAATKTLSLAAESIQDPSLTQKFQALHLGNPRFEESDVIALAMKSAIDARPKGAGYDPHSGSDKDRSELAPILSRMFFTSENNFIANAQGVILTNGATVGVNAAFSAAKVAVVDREAVVLLSNPGYPPYENIAMLNGYKVAHYELGAQDGFFFTYEAVERAIQTAGAENVRLFVYNYPHNPTGATPNKLEAQAMAEVVNKLNKKYPQIVFLEECLYYGTISADFALWTPYAFLDSFARDSTIMIGSGSKIGLAGPRAGFIYASDQKLASMCANYISLTIAGSGYISHAGYIAALKALDLHQGQSVNDKNHPRFLIADFFQQRISLVSNTLSEICGALEVPEETVILHRPKGGMYLWVDFAPIFQSRRIPAVLAQNFNAVGKDFLTSDDLQSALLWMCEVGHAPISIAPGEIFGVVNDSKMCARLSCVSPKVSDLVTALTTLKALVELTSGKKLLA